MYLLFDHYMFVITSYSIHYTKLYDQSLVWIIDGVNTGSEEFVITSYSIHYTKLYEILDEIRFRFDNSGISREQVMMLDILANNDWKRAIYFSSPGGSDVALSLLRGMTGRDGYIKQNGMAFELSPLGSSGGGVDRDIV